MFFLVNGASPARAAARKKSEPNPIKKIEHHEHHENVVGSFKTLVKQRVVKEIS